MTKVHNVHVREIAAPVAVLGQILDTLGADHDRLWATDIWVAEPVVFDRPLGVGADGGHGSIRYSVEEYESGRRVVFRFTPRGGLSGVHGFELEELSPGRTRLTHFLEAEMSPWMRPLRPILIGWHDAMVETAFDRAELEATGSLTRRTPIPLWLRVVNRVEVSVARALGKLPPAAGQYEDGGHGRLPKSAHTSRPWRIHEIAPDFRLEDVWALPTPGGPEDFPRLVRQFAAGDTSTNPSRAARALFAIRWKVGELLGWDDPDAGHGSQRPTLRDRLPDDLREAPGPEFDRLPFSSLYLLDDEWAAEIVNRTVHGVMHIGWVSDETGAYRGQMAVLVKPNGLLGSAYMAAIMPFRHLIVYPPLMREIGQEWRASVGGRDHRGLFSRPSPRPGRACHSGAKTGAVAPRVG